MIGRFSLAFPAAQIESNQILKYLNQIPECETFTTYYQIIVQVNTFIQIQLFSSQVQQSATTEESEARHKSTKNFKTVKSKKILR